MAFALLHFLAGTIGALALFLVFSRLAGVTSFSAPFGVIFVGIVAAFGANAQEPAPVTADAAIVCDACEAWNEPIPPYRIFGNTYYVGVAGLASILIASDSGHILLDGGLPQSAPLIDRNLAALGFRTEGIRLIAVSHEHYDHVGGIAALQRTSGAAVAASLAAASALEQGHPTPGDPQSQSQGFPRVAGIRVIADGEVLRIGDLAITAHFTPGHTPGSTSWTWQSCEDRRCLEIVYADSLNSISDSGFRFSDHPDFVEAFRASIDRVQRLPCDILLTVHPGVADLAGKRQLRDVEGKPDAFIDSAACAAYAENAARLLEQRLEDERR